MRLDQTLPKARQREPITKEVAGEILVYDLNREEAHCLNSTAAVDNGRVPFSVREASAGYASPLADLQICFNPFIEPLEKRSTKKHEIPKSELRVA